MHELQYKTHNTKKNLFGKQNLQFQHTHRHRSQPNSLVSVHSEICIFLLFISDMDQTLYAHLEDKFVFQNQLQNPNQRIYLFRFESSSRGKSSIRLNLKFKK